MSKTGRGLAAYCKAQLGGPYWWGTFGQISTPELLAQKRQQYPGYYQAADFEQQLGRRVHDCVGLIKGYLWSATPTSAPRYRGDQDVSVAGLYDVCDQRGPISTIPDEPGVCVFMRELGHVGVYVGGGMAIEAMGHAYGVVTTALASRPWAFWGKPRWISYGGEAEPAGDPAPAVETCSVELPLLRQSMTGEAVRAAQQLLLLRGFDLPRWGADGDFGGETGAAIAAMQTAAGITVDKEIGPESWAALITKSYKGE